MQPRAASLRVSGLGRLFCSIVNEPPPEITPDDDVTTTFPGLWGRAAEQETARWAVVLAVVGGGSQWHSCYRRVS